MKSRSPLANLVLLPLLASLAACAGTDTRVETGARDQQSPEPVATSIIPAKAFAYPTPRRDEQRDNYHGTEVLDAYRWLEDPDSEETRAWVQAENKVTFDYLGSIPEREAIQKRLTQLWDYEKFGTPFKQGGRYFFYRNDGLQNQSVLYWTPSLSAEPRLLLDPNTLSEDGTVALAGTTVSEDGKHLAYGLQAAGSDWAEWHVRNIDTGKDLDDKLEWIKFSRPQWDKKSTGFYYGRYPKPAEGASLTDANFDQKVYFHKLGAPQSEDTLVFETPENPKWSSGASVSEDGRYLLVEVSKGTGPVNQVHFQALGAKNSVVTPLIGEFDAMYNFLGNQGPIFWFHTDKDAPRGRIIAIDTRKPDPKHWKEIVPEGEATLEAANLVGGKLVTTYLRDAYSEIIIRDLKGKQIKKVDLPGIGSASGFGGKTRDMETFYSFTNFTTPQTIYRYDFKSGKSTVFKQPKVDFDPELYEIKQIFYASKDGTKVPMFITHKKGIELDGQNPTMLYGYGGFNISITPSFSVDRLAWLEMGGVLAIPNLRGGGEYGEEWHLAGTKLNKQNVFDDFIAAAEWLIASKYTSPAKLAISGRSNGGLLVGAAMTQRPELFGAALPGVGVLDMLRFHKFTIGWAWIDDYGSSDDAAEFKALYAYSPYHNLEAVKYPSTLITTADHDDRVVPAHSFKFAAELQRLHTGDNPVMIRIETKAGHGAGKPTSKKIEDIADNHAFLVKTLGMEYPATEDAR